MQPITFMTLHCMFLTVMYVLQLTTYIYLLLIDVHGKYPLNIMYGLLFYVHGWVSIRL
jgi:hypothetical protein